MRFQFSANAGGRARPRVCAPRATAQTPPTREPCDMRALMRVLETDSRNLFNEQGMDLSVYASAVKFQDPITKYDTVEGFAQNLKFLKDLFNPTYDMLDIRQLSDTEVEARWTMGFDVLPIKNSPLGKAWTPRMEFTGTTVYGVNSEGLIDKHIDRWDNISNQRYFSAEAFSDVLQQIFNPQRTPQIPTPQYTLMKRKKEFSVRKYDPFVVATVALPERPDKEERTRAFRSLAGFIFGKNEDGSKLQMTTPVLSSASYMQFVLPVAGAADAPVPVPDSPVSVVERPGGLYATVRFAGIADDEAVERKKVEVLASMRECGLQPEVDDEGQPVDVVMKYNDPRVKPPFRRNEVLIPIASGFDMWCT